MRNNKLYAAAMLSKEISVISQKVNLANNLINDIKIKSVSNCTSEKTTPKHTIEAHKELCWKIDIINDYLLYIQQSLHRLENYAADYYDGGEEFLQEISLLIQEALRNNGKVSSKKLYSLLCEEMPDEEQ